MVRRPSFEQLIASIGNTLFRLETQISEIEEIFEEFTVTKEGGSAVVFGHRFSGRRSVINKVIAKYRKLVDIKCVDSFLYPTDVMASRFLDIEEISTDYMDLLENRVRSRLLNKVISFSKISSKLSDLCGALRYFLLLGGRNTDSLVNNFMELPQIRQILKSIYYDRGCDIAVLKQILTVFYTFMEVENIINLSDERCMNTFIEAAQTVVSTEDPMKVIFESLTLRQLCLLVSCMHMLTTKRRSIFTYCEIASTYKLFVKKNLPPLYVVDNSILYKELDALSSLRLIEASPHSGQQGYKKTSLQISADDVESYLDVYPSLPTGFKKWLNDFDW